MYKRLERQRMSAAPSGCAVSLDLIADNLLLLSNP